MNIWEDPVPRNDPKKWTEWTMLPKKAPRELTKYTSAVVFATSAIYMVEFFAL